MLKQLRFKNWRSLRDVTIDLSPLTVFIGANSSGKTNIIEGIKFMRDAKLRGLMPLVAEFGYQAIQSREPLDDGIVEFEFLFDSFSYQPESKIELFDEVFKTPSYNRGNIIDLLKIKFDAKNFPFFYSTGLAEGGNHLEDTTVFEHLPNKENPDEIRSPLILGDGDSMFRHFIWQHWAYTYNELVSRYNHRIQFMDATFLPISRLAGKYTGYDKGIDSDGTNTILLIEFLQDAYPDIFSKLNTDIQWLLKHVTSVNSIRDKNNRDIELLVQEMNEKVAPTISVGTLRIIGMLVALHILDVERILPRKQLMPDIPLRSISPSTPGLVVIEEPDTALNPGVLRKFVELLRGYVENPDGTRPRQIIMTTHNPTFLNYFQPDEVRVVERGEDGYTTVNKVPDYVKDIWLKDGEYALGEVWLGNSFGGLS